MTVQFLHNEAAGIFNIGTGVPGTWNTIAEGVIEGVEPTGKIEYIEMPKDLLGKYQNYTCAEMGKSHSSKLKMPQFSLKEAVKDYVTNYVVPKRYL